MAIDVFTEDDDLEKIRPDILSLGVDEFESEHLEVFRVLVRELRVWHVDNAINRIISSGIASTGSSETLALTTYPFDVDKFLNWETEIKSAAIYLALSLAYVKLAKDLPIEEDGMASQAKFFREEYEREWALAVRAGFSYDWDDSGDIGPDESSVTYRSLVRQ